MAAQPRTYPNVIELTIENGDVSEDGELLIFTIKDVKGGVAHLGIRWDNIGLANQMIARTAERAGKRRKQLKKSNLYQGGKVSPQLVKSFQVSEFPDQRIKVLSLESPVGFRCDFAIPTNMVDPLGRKFPEAIAAELVQDSTLGKERPH